MKIGISYGKVYRDNVLDDSSQKVLKRLKDIGYECLDYNMPLACMRPDPIFKQERKVWVNHFKEMKKMIEGEGLCVAQAHATFNTCYDPNYPFEVTNEIVDQINKEIEATSILGSKYIVIHPICKYIAPFREEHYLGLKQDDYLLNMRELKKFEPALKEFNVKGCLENLFLFSFHSRHAVATGCSTAKDLLEYKNGLNSDHYGICFDTGHANILWSNLTEEIKMLGDNLSILHVHDNSHADDEHLAVGTGSIDWKAFAKALKDIGYKGNFCMEIHIANMLKLGKDLAWQYLQLAHDSARTVLTEANFK